MLLAGVGGLMAVASPQSAAAQDSEPGPAPSVDPAATDGETTTDDSGGGRGRQVFTPEDFTQFAPNNVLDMLRRIPGFDISGGNNGERGLGQADFNVLINGQRLTGKSDSPRDQLGRIAADDVVRIEIVDGATLDIPGLSGQVANVTVEVGGLSGQFEWSAEYRPRIETFYGGRFNGSLSGSSGDFTYSVSARHRGFRGGADGVILLTDAAGQTIDEQTLRNRGFADDPKVSATLGWKNAANVVANLNGSYGWGRNRFERTEDGTGVFAPRILQDSVNGSERYDYEVGGDIAFDLLGGRLKLIGLERFDHSDFAQTVIDTLFDGSPATGGRFTALSDSGERIARAEFSWSGGGADWQVSGEAAFNRLDRIAALFALEPDGSFSEIEFPDNASGVSEDRYDGAISYGRPLASNLSLQLIGGGEFSRLKQSGDNANTREFWRPKGSASLAWQPADGLDVSFKVARTVGQLSFGDFLANVFLVNDNSNAGNAELVPPQAWETDLEVQKSLGAWGSATLKLFDRRIEDLVEIVPVPGGQSPGNIASASRRGLDFDATLELSQIGWNGARLDLSVELEKSSLVDPLTGEERSFSGRQFRELFLSVRHDIPASDWAYGGQLYHAERGLQYRLSEVSVENEGPVFMELFVEHKDVLGMTARLSANNLLNAQVDYSRTVYDGFRDANPVLFTESGQFTFGEILRFSLQGNF